MSPDTKNETPNNPNKDLQIPKWIKEDYFLPLLEEHVPDFVRIKKFIPIAATSPGENYTSVMVRVLLELELKDGSTQNTSYILKTQLEASEGASFVDNLLLFPKEQKMYEVYLPKYVELYKAAGVDVKLAPRCLKIEQTPERITLIMEDLKHRNFQNVDRLQGFDMAHMRCVLQKLAELHAASVVIYEQCGSYGEMFHLSLYSESNLEIFTTLIKQRQPFLHKAMREWGLPDIEKYIANSLSPAEYFGNARKVNTFDPNEFNVLNHGDCWSNNIMFNYKQNGEINETIFVDLQVGKWGTPAQDLWYLITNSAAYDIRVKEFDNFVHIYHERLSECLKLLQYSGKTPTLKELHWMMIKYGFWGPLTAFGPTTAILFPTDKDANITNLLGTGADADALRYKSFVNPIYACTMCQLLPFFEHKGILYE